MQMRPGHWGACVYQGAWQRVLTGTVLKSTANVVEQDHRRGPRRRDSELHRGESRYSL